MNIEKGSPRSLFTAADPEYFEMFANGRDSNVATGELLLTFKTIRIERAEVREYIPDAADDPVPADNA